MNKLLLGFLIAGSAAMASPALADVNLLQDGSFELSSAPGFSPVWTVGSTPSGSPTNPASQNPVVIPYGSTATYPGGAYGEAIPADPLVSGSPDAAGRQAAYFVADAATQTLSQQVLLVAGVLYTFGFDAYIPANGFANPQGATLTATINGSSFASLSDTSVPVTTWTPFSDTRSFSAAELGGASALVTFNFTFTAPSLPTNQGGTQASDFVVDRVFLTAAVPEASSWAMLIAGLGMVGFARKRQSRTIVLA